MKRLGASPDIPRARSGLWDLDPQLIVDEYGGFARDSFANTDGHAVLITAFNEEHDLPATLLSLAISESDVSPIVVDNGSSDGTAMVARKMGARVLSESAPSKINAIKLGLEHLESRGQSRVFFTDADTLVGRRWASRMDSIFEKSAGPESGGMLTGAMVVSGGDSRLVDVGRTVYALCRDTERLITKSKSPIARGFNYLLDLGQSGAITTEINKLPNDLFPHDDHAIKDIVLAAGGLVRSTLHPDTIVTTKGDRFRSVSEILMVKLGRRDKRELYMEQYGNLMGERYTSESGQ